MAKFARFPGGRQHHHHHHHNNNNHNQNHHNRVPSPAATTAGAAAAAASPRPVLSNVEKDLAYRTLFPSDSKKPLEFRRGVVSTAGEAQRKLEAAKVPCLNPDVVAARTALEKKQQQQQQNSKKVPNHDDDGDDADPDKYPPKPKLEFVPATVAKTWLEHPITHFYPRLSRGRSAGLANLGNTCFMNSILQCLAHTDALLAFLGRMLQQKDGADNNINNNNNNNKQRNNSHMVVRELWTTLSMIRDSQGIASKNSSIQPREMARALAPLTKGQMRVGHQEDSHEYLIALLDAVQSASLHHRKNLDLASEHTSGIGRIFGGWLRGRVEWSGGSSDRFDPFTVFSLDIGGAHNVDQCMKLFERKDVLSKDNAYKTPDGKYVTAHRWEQLYTLPPILVLHLKRFRHELRRGAKINKNVAFSTELSVRCAADGDAQDHVYDLYAVNVHIGSNMNCGHYISYCKNSAHGTWCKCDDSSVRPVSIDEVLQQQAYVLFYKKRTFSCTSLMSAEKQQQEQEEAVTLSEALAAAEAVEKDAANYSEDHKQDAALRSITCPAALVEKKKRLADDDDDDDDDD
eukprot:PhM_4_TR15662/c0_g1_i1/m.3373/K11855/USP36_42; ubiquitin carboxyl-terminal hydrolase 36/42